MLLIAQLSERLLQGMSAAVINVRDAARTADDTMVNERRVLGASLGKVDVRNVSGNSH